CPTSVTSRGQEGVDRRLCPRTVQDNRPLAAREGNRLGRRSGSTLRFVDRLPPCRKRVATVQDKPYNHDQGKGERHHKGGDRAPPVRERAHSNRPGTFRRRRRPGPERFPALPPPTRSAPQAR